MPTGVSISFTPLSESADTVRYPVDTVPAYIGSGAYADVLLRGEGVAETHVRLTWNDDSLYIEDMGQGLTRINDREVKRSRLQNGDILEVGDTKLLLQLTVASGTSSKVSSSPGSNVKTSAATPVVWAGGFSSSFRDWFEGEVGRQHGIETRSFRTGEETLLSMSRALSEDSVPDLLILDLKLPIINGINVAIATRAYELGFNQSQHLPLVFLFKPPASSSFEKVVKFCQPVTPIEPHGDESRKDEVKKLLEDLKERRQT